MKAYSQDLRERVLRAVDQGYQRADIIKLFGVSRATIKRYLKQRRQTGEVCVKAIPGRPPKKFAPLQAGLVAQLEAHADATLETHYQLWKEQQGVQVSTSTMSRAIRRIGWTRKKRRWVPVNATKRHEPPGENTSSIWMPESSSSLMSAAPTSVCSALCPCPKGERAYGSVPRNRGKNTTLIAALGWSGMGESMIIEGSANAVSFEQYVEEILAPSLTAGQIVIMDNLAAHKGKKVEQLIQDRGCQLLFCQAIRLISPLLKKRFPN